MTVLATVLALVTALSPGGECRDRHGGFGGHHGMAGGFGGGSPRGSGALADDQGTPMTIM